MIFLSNVESVERLEAWHLIVVFEVYWLYEVVYSDPMKGPDPDRSAIACRDQISLIRKELKMTYSITLINLHHYRIPVSSIVKYSTTTTPTVITLQHCLQLKELSPVSFLLQLTISGCIVAYLQVKG